MIASMGTLVGTAPLTSQVTALQRQRVILPEGTVLTVRTQNTFNSRDARVGDVITTVVTDSVTVEGLTVIPAGSRIEGTVSIARPATSRESGIVGVDFTRLILRNGSSVPIAGKLTSMDPNERRQIDAQGDARVVFVGGRRGAGAAIGAIGAGSPDDPVSGVLGALGQLLSRGADVTVPANTPLAIQLENGVWLIGTSSDNPGSIYTSADMIRRAQQALRSRSYYYGPIDGRLNNATRTALFDFQLDNEINATGNLDRVTASELGIAVGGGPGGSGLTPAEAALITSNARTLTDTWRSTIGISTSGQLSPRRNYLPAELELYFALSAFTDNAALFDRMLEMSGNQQGIQAASNGVLAAARRVDAAFSGVAAPNRTVAAWRTIQSMLTDLDPRYPY
jgi:peptidoglycan hydrolase-like protein with peptidoglycan-binding domain